MMVVRTGFGLQRALLQTGLAVRRRARTSALRSARERRLVAWREEDGPRAFVFLGDSFVARFPIGCLPTGLAEVALRGMPGETVSELDDRLDVSLVPCSMIAVETGANDLLRGRRPAAVQADYAALLDHLRRSAPDARLVLLSLPPLAGWRAAPRAVADVNAAIRSLGQATGATVVDIHTPLARPGGSPSRAMSTDGVHLTVAGYQRVAAALERSGIGSPPPPRSLLGDDG